jgi:DHA1 family tetracycline resistance protein-like MFS transporter
LANALYGILVLPESLPKARRTPFSWRKGHPLAALRLLRSNTEVCRVASVLFLSNLAHEVFPAVFVLYAGHRYGWDQVTIGLALAAVGVASAVVQGGLVRRVVPRLGERPTMVAGLVCGGAGSIIFGLAPSGGWIWLAIPVAALWGLFGPAAQSLMTQRIAASEQGRLQGALNGLRGVSGLVGPVLFTASFAAGVSQPGPSITWGAPFFLAAILLLLALGALAPAVLGRRSAGGKATRRAAGGLGEGPLLVRHRT